jgi:hypothetical protein
VTAAAEIRRDVASAKVVHVRAFGFKALMLIEAQLGVANTLTQNGAEDGKAKSQVLFSGRQVDIRSRRASRRKGTISLCKTMSGLYATVLPCSYSGLERKGRSVERMRCLNERETISRVRRLDGIKVPSTEGRNNRRGSNTTGPWSHHRATSVADYAFRFRNVRQTDYAGAARNTDAGDAVGGGVPGIDLTTNLEYKQRKAV